ncbi:hypothetical protein L1987_74955 [Smallanthus sonchifolius]|uniref:Uncharacterized protein n=1 Tax=Smallanthus sonchifolius TaxID=185202 RepID=A0ACB9A4C9_9ASTR|nr:hypothetical protein L1987_74955 [Smallanthus sonchifolius]
MVNLLINGNTPVFPQSGVSIFLAIRDHPRYEECHLSPVTSLNAPEKIDRSPKGSDFSLIRSERQPRSVLEQRDCKSADRLSRFGVFRMQFGDDH